MKSSQRIGSAIYVEHYIRDTDQQMCNTICQTILHDTTQYAVCWRCGIDQHGHHFVQLMANHGIIAAEFQFQLITDTTDRSGTH